MAAVALRQRDNAHGQRHPGFDLGQRRSAPAGRRAVEQDQLRGAAADIEQDHSVGLRIDKRSAAGRGQGRFGLAIDHLELEADFFDDAGTEFFAVIGGTARLGRDQAGARDLATAHLVAADGERLDCAADGRLGNPARDRHPLPEADDAGECIDDPETVGGWPCHQQSAIVGAEIERAIGPVPRRRRSAIATRETIRRAPTPPGPWLRRRIMSNAGAAGAPALVLHRCPSLPRQALSKSSPAAAMSKPDRTTSSMRLARATDARCTHGRS